MEVGAGDGREPLKLEKKAGGNYCCVSVWVEKYFKDCLCSLKDEVSFGLGIISLICWGLAEIPQIITNFHNKSAAGLSLSFLLTWILGDIFNLVGCILDPATLPTQFFTALLYTATTVALLLQCIYYEHFLRWWHNEGGRLDKKNLSNVQVNVGEEEKEWLLQASKTGHHHFIPSGGSNNGVVRVPTTQKSQRHFYFMSARTLASSDTPPRCSYIKPRSGPPALHNPYSSSDDDGEEQPTPAATAAAITQPRSIPPRAYGAFLAAAAAYSPVGGKAAAALEHVTAAGRMHDAIGANSNAGQWLGWLMAAIYMGGRIPQIWLNASTLFFSFLFFSNVHGHYYHSRAPSITY
ncbi:unnamed protein product [Cuscuta campestris]|uniref:PQ-loop repeat-containing protein n=1 Tax=Cuscuta campestris TaxID=132261 RepID=A0A484KID3_9ASTE|nr:unnamed protein product [Cuscuta campestris]